MAIRRLGILCGGGDAPGLNAVLRAVVRVGRTELGIEVLGIEDGFAGLMETPRVRLMDLVDVSGLLPRGGTILGTTNRSNPFWWSGPPGVARDCSDEVLAKASQLGLDGLIVVGGEGTLKIARDLQAKGLPCVGVPKTIDNDISLTEQTFGFDTAVTTAMEAIDRLHTTAESHHRVMVVELMGRQAGWIALTAGLAGGADAILIPEIPFSVQSVAATIQDREQRQKRFSIVVVAEGAAPIGGEETYKDPQTQRLGGVGDKVAHEIERTTGRETRLTVLGHVQRGGSPSSFDRVLATRYGAAAVRLAHAECFGEMPALRNGGITSVLIADAVAQLKLVPLDGELVRTARGLGISLGD